MNESNMIQKPITIVREEFLQNLSNLINNSNLPYFVIENILKDCIRETSIASQKQLEIDKSRYKEELAKLQSQSVEDGD